MARVTRLCKPSRAYHRSKLGLPVERDPHFVADKPLSAYAEVAYTRGLIIT
jgi:hypothetical protein